MEHLINVQAKERPRAILEGVIRLFQAVFPDRLRAVYLLGSRNDGSAASISDLDALVLFKENFRSFGEWQQTQRIVAACQLISPVRLDLRVMAERHERFLKAYHDVRLKLNGQLVHGEDIRDRIPLPSVEEYQRYVIRWPWRFIPLLHDTDMPAYPLSYPDPDAELFGYVRVRKPDWYPDGVKEGTKELVATVFWIATALLALDAGQFAASRADVLRLSREHFDREWASFLEEMHQKCKTEWDYRVPEDPAQRAVLRRLCSKTLALCNDYAKRYGDLPIAADALAPPPKVD